MQKEPTESPSTCLLSLLTTLPSLLYFFGQLFP